MSEREMDDEMKNREEKRENRSDLVASEVSKSESSSNRVISEAVIEIKSTKRRCGTRKDLDLHEVRENSLEPIASDIECNENSSNSVISEALNEIKCAESRCSTHKDDDLGDIGENSSNRVVPETAIEVRCIGTESLGAENMVSKAKTVVLDGKRLPEDKMKVNVPDPVRGTCVVIDVKGGDDGLDSEDRDGEKVCRICHLNFDRRSDTSDLIQLGCDCKDELGISHRHCAEAWFKLKGNRWCEICGESAKNVTGVGDNRFMEEWNDRRMVGIGSSSSVERGRYRRCQPFGNFLMACLVIAFILPWFFRVNMF